MIVFDLLHMFHVVLSHSLISNFMNMYLLTYYIVDSAFV